MTKKVLFVIRELTGGGAERALSNITTHFPDDWQIDLLMNNRDFIEYPYKGKVLSLNIPEPKNRNSITHQLYAIVKRTIYLKKLKKENDYDACISFLDSSNISNVLSGKKYCKTIVSFRLYVTASESSLLYRLTARPLMLIYKRADKIVAVSQEIEEMCKRKFRIPSNKMTTIVNGYDCKKIEEYITVKPEKELNLVGKKVVVTVGRLMEAKGQWHLIRAFRKVISRIPNAILLIAGTGELKSYLEKIIVANQLQENVFLLGYCKNPFWYCDKADVFVLPSMYEGYPNALAEAVCCGTACIATDFHSGAREILAPDMDIHGKRIARATKVQYGILTPLCSGTFYKGNENLERPEEEMADAIIEVLENDFLKKDLQERSIRRKKDLDINMIVEKWLKVISE